MLTKLSLRTARGAYLERCGRGATLTTRQYKFTAVSRKDRNDSDWVQALWTRAVRQYSSSTSTTSGGHGGANSAVDSMLDDLFKNKPLGFSRDDEGERPTRGGDRRSGGGRDRYPERRMDRYNNDDDDDYDDDEDNGGGGRRSYGRDRERGFGGRSRGREFSYHDRDQRGRRGGGGGGGGGYRGGRDRRTRGEDDDMDGGDRRERGGGSFEDLQSRMPAQDWSDMSKLPQVVKNIYVEHDEVKHMPIAEVTKWRNQHDMTIFGRDCPNPILTFDQAPFRDFARRELKRIFAAPTIIQSQGWPVAMHGRDMVGSAMTGSGKTLSFILPALEHIAAQQAALGEDAVSPAMRRHGDVRSDPIALILAPTRELAMQIHDEAQRYARGYNIRIACLYGGQGNRGTQAQQLRGRPHLIVATPGRLMDFVGEGLTTLRRTSFWVMDEADRMLDMGFEPQIRAIGEQIRPERQVLMWSATWPKKIQALAAEFLKDPIRVRIGSDELTVNKNVEQRFEICDPYSRFPRILDFIRAQPIGTKILIFASTKSSTEWLGDELYREGIDTVVLHGDKAQTHRTRALEQFKSNNVSVLVATDVAARGLHVNDINVVINYEFPPDFENYIHRIGRTGRAGKSGLSISYISSKDFQHLQDIVQVLKEAGQPIPDEIRNALRDQERGRSGNRGGGGGGGRPSFRGGSDRRGDSRNFSRGGGRSGGGRGGGRSGRPSSQDRDEDW